MVDSYERSALRLNSMACVSLPTCGLALAESQRYLPDLVSEIESVLEDTGLRHDAITIRMTGCPNGCARPYIAEIGFVGRAPGKYNLYLGGGFHGERLSKLYAPSVKSDEIKTVLEPIIRDYAENRKDGEHFGDFTIRADYIKATENGRDFHKDFVEPTLSV
jgi:sulfite reductase (NADPH) hemoprotein beta-component